MYAAIVVNSPKLIGSERTSADVPAGDAEHHDQRHEPRPRAASQNPARVSRALRSSTATNRAKGTWLVAERSS